MAEICKLPVESKELKAILAELPQDDDWDESVALERGYKKAGLTSYHLVGLKDFTTSLPGALRTPTLRKPPSRRLPPSTKVALAISSWQPM